MERESRVERNLIIFVDESPSGEPERRARAQCESVIDRDGFKWTKNGSDIVKVLSDDIVFGDPI